MRHPKPRQCGASLLSDLLSFYTDAANPKMYDAVEDYLQRADPEGQASEVTWFTAWRVKHPRPKCGASAPDPASRP